MGLSNDGTLIFFNDKLLSQKNGRTYQKPSFEFKIQTTVGYGDLVPVSVWGKLVGSLCAIAGKFCVIWYLLSIWQYQKLRKWCQNLVKKYNEQIIQTLFWNNKPSIRGHLNWSLVWLIILDCQPIVYPHFNLWQKKLSNASSSPIVIRRGLKAWLIKH